MTNLQTNTQAQGAKMQNSIINTYRQQIETSAEKAAEAKWGRSYLTSSEDLVIENVIKWLGQLFQGEEALLIATFGVSIPTAYLQGFTEEILAWGEPPYCDMSEAEWCRDLQSAVYAVTMRQSFDEIFEELLEA